MTQRRTQRRMTGRAVLAALVVLTSAFTSGLAGSLTATSTVSAADGGADEDPSALDVTVVPTRPAGTDPWLATVNWWRSFGGAADGSGAPFPTVTTLPADALGPQNEVDYLVSIWRQGSTYCAHGEDPAHPKPPADYTHSVLFCGPPTLSDAVDGWLNTPYHANPLLSPTVARVGAGLATDGTRTASAAGAFAMTTITRAYTWPADGGALPRTQMTVKESPDPTVLCPSETGTNPGQPVFAWYPTARTFVSLTVTDASGAVPACVLSDDAQAKRAVAAGDALDTFIVFAKRPYTVGAPVTVDLVTIDPATGGRSSLKWTFSPLSNPGIVQASINGRAGGATVVVAPPIGIDDGGTPILERQLVLFARSIGIVGDPVWRLPIRGTGTQDVVVPAGDYWACASARNALGWSACGTYSRLLITDPPLGAAAAATAGFRAVDPFRVVDTREPGSAVARVRAGQVAIVDLRSVMPGDAVAVALNLASVNSSAPGWVRAYPCTAAAPETSSLNPQPGAITTNAAIVKVGDGRLCLQTFADTDLVIDVNGWLTTGSDAGLVTSTARRVLDTRASPTMRRLLPSGVVEVPVVTGSSTVAVALNVTAVDPAANGFVTAWPCGTARPFVANLTPAAGVTRPNLVNVRVGRGGSICLYSTVATDLVVDLLGEYRTGATARFAALDPVRLADSRLAALSAAPDGAALLRAGDVVALQGTLTAVGAPTAGFLSTYACTSQPWPGTANVNFGQGETSGNAVLMPSSNGYACVRNSSGAALVVDVTGVWKSA